MDSGLDARWAGKHLRREGHMCPLASVFRGLKGIVGVIMVMLFTDFPRLSSQRVVLTYFATSGA